MLRVAEHWCGTDTGLQRRANEDSLLVRSPLFVVADGMGGAQAGEVASHIAVETFRAGLQDGSDPERSLVHQVEQANAHINELSHQSPEHAGMGTTITVAYVGEQDVSIAHVGDSRAYCHRDGELLRLTDDHSLVDELIRQGKLTPEEAEEHPQRSVITRALGPEATVEVDVRSFRGRPDDVYLLCSDGLTTMLGEAELLELLSAHTSLHDSGEALIAAANAAGGKDNITVVLLRLEEVLTAAERLADGHTTITAVAPASAAPSTTQERPIPPNPESRLDAAVQEQRLTPASEPAVVPLRPRRAERAPQPTRGARLRRRLRRMRGPVVALVIVGLLVAGGYLALQSVYFIGTNQRGLVTMFSGIPYQLPGGLKLYSSDYVSGVSASTLPAARRQALLDHSLRSEGNAAELMRQLELGQLSGG
ncbi:MAG TPA: Stp1/IreP family PP2C-type Ser/Thr phosphatase [Solirubrobacteraceae bacterium]|jgi:serine/threonine protein phosphatase PrpC|nr:Stp1/IreP family PP2C-type Ser/Thr phosphatase [Solirubrobacteraceae bacterium]